MTGEEMESRDERGEMREESRDERGEMTEEKNKE